MSQAPAASLTFPPIVYQGTPVLTTDMLAYAYEVEPKQIRQNYANNKKRFVEGKHFFSVSGQELKTFLLCVENFDSQISPKVRVLTLWTERGAARHAKMLNSDKAWDVFEMLEETFFHVAKAEPVSIPDKLPAASLSITPSTVADRKPLRSLVNAWARVSGHPFDACWSQLKAAFSLTDIRDLPQEWIPDAVAWVQERIDKIGREPQTPGTMPALLPSTPGILSAELERYASKFERLAHSVEDMEQLLESVRRLSYPLTSEAARTLTGGHADGRGRLEAALEEHLDRSRRLAQELVPCARLGINIMRDLALGQGR